MRLRLESVPPPPLPKGGIFVVTFSRERASSIVTISAARPSPPFVPAGCFAREKLEMDCPHGSRATSRRFGQGLPPRHDGARRRGKHWAAACQGLSRGGSRRQNRRSQTAAPRRRRSRQIAIADGSR